MHEYDSLAAVQFFKDSFIGRIPQPFVVITGHQPDTIGLHNRERIVDLAQAAFGIRKRNDRKDPEACRMPAREIGRVFVHAARRLRSRFCITEPHPGRSKRKNSSRNLLLVHSGNGLLWSPVRISGMKPPACRRCNARLVLHKIKTRNEVMMYIDQTALRCGSSRPRDAFSDGANPGQTECRNSRKKLASGMARMRPTIIGPITAQPTRRER